jgi:hypothetical protein
MPGPRLTHTDRRQIAAWLTDGLGFAEIARRLGRPTSTISREVSRNGDPGAYRADHAHQAAAERAPRRRPARRPSPPEAAPEFADQFAALLATTGLPRMSARVFVCLLLSDRGQTSADLVQRLRVSPASISKSIAYLGAMDLVSRVPDPGRRRERYLIADDVWLRAWQTDTGAHSRVAAAAHRGAALLGAGTTAGARLGEMARFFTWLSEQMAAPVPVFDDSVRRTHPADFELLNGGHLHFFRHRWALDRLHTDLGALGYALLTVDLASCETPDALRGAVAAAVPGWPEGLRLGDGLTDHLLDADRPQVVLTVTGWDRAHRTLGTEAWRLLDLLAHAARWHLLFGRRLIVLIETSDPDADVAVGTEHIGWNRHEWLLKHRTGERIPPWIG